MKAVVFVLSLAWAFGCSIGLNCFVCENQPSNRHCRLFGRIKTCEKNEEACQNEVRRNGRQLLITKTCKQALACNNNFIQNPRPAWYPSQCNTRAPNSVCRCCCSTDLCNEATFCRGPAEPQCRRIPEPQNGKRTCEFNRTWTEVGSKCFYQCDEGYEISGPESVNCVRRGDGAVWDADIPKCLPKPCDAVRVKSVVQECTDEFNFGSTCNFRCADKEHEIYPPQSNTLTCEIRNSSKPEWNKPQPCCTRVCPPHALMDACIILDSSLSVTRRNWPIMVNFTQNIINTFDVSPDATQFSIFSFGRRPNTRTQILFNEYSSDKQGLLDAVGGIPYAPSSTFTGTALRHAQNVMFAEASGNRTQAKDVVIIITDGQTSERDRDNAKEAGAALRNSGVLMFGIGVVPPAEDLTVEQLRASLREIVGDQSPIEIASEGFEGLNERLLKSLSGQICENRCDL